MTYTLYGRPWSGSLTVEWLLEEMGLPYDKVWVTGYRENVQPPEFAEINPLRAVPTLTLEDGSVLTESAAIMMWLAEAHGSVKWAPAIGSVERADYLRWMSFMSASLYPVAMQIYHPENYSDDVAHHDDIVARGRLVLDQQWAVMRAALGERDHLVGSHMTAADIYLLMFAKWFADMGEIDDDNAMAAWREGMLARPAIKSVLARHESGAWA